MSGMLDEAWAALHGEAGRPADLPVSGGTGASGQEAPLPCVLAVGELATATAGVFLLAAAELAEARGLGRPDVALDAAHTAVAFASERHVLLDGRPPGPSPDPLSAFAPAADGWVRLHAAYPHHRAALMRALGHPAGGSAGALTAVRGLPAREVEAAVVAAGGCAAAVRDADTWQAEGAGAALAGQGLLDFERAVAHRVPELPSAGGGSAGRPAAGLRVVDLTRVICGPVATRLLAALGAQVLRVDAPLHAELAPLWLDTGPGRRSAHLQLRNRPDRERLHRLLDDADVLVAGYRPGALDDFGLGRAVLEEKHPQLCTVTLSAWGEAGPWGARRGFDSLVQAATGIAREVGDGHGTPGVLPVQALDHGTGYLVAAAALRALTLRAREHHASHARLALARTAMWLLAHGRTPPAQAPPAVAPGPYRATLSSPLGTVGVVRPPGSIDGRPLGWATGPPVPGADAPRWR